MALKQIKNKIIATRKTGKVTKAMEAVSAVKMRKSQERALQGKPYAEAAVRILHRVSHSREGKEFFSKNRRNGNGAHCFVVITSDKGLAGSLNSSVIKQVTRALTAYDRDAVRIIAYGKKAVDHFTREGYIVDAAYTNISDGVAVADIEPLIAHITQSYNEETYSHVSVAFQSFISTFEQNAVMHQVLPLEPEILELMVHDIVPKKGKYSDLVRDIGEPMYTIEPSTEEVLETLLLQLVQIMLYHALLEHKASEHSARMVAMKNATDKTKEVVKALTLAYNKERQSVITAEVSEITGGIEAMKK